jgi:hypothetical protein
MFKSTMKQRPVASFFALTYLISWVFWVPTVLYIKLALPADEVPGWLMIPNLIGTWGPFFATLIVTGILEGKPGVKKLLSSLLVWRVSRNVHLGTGVPALSGHLNERDHPIRQVGHRSRVGRGSPGHRAV